LLFISHANPQDNAAASWFATRLTLLGYEVWCDLKNTHAGESNFWLKVQKKIENEAAKFIFILSNNSRDFEKKPGIYKEVQTADNLRHDNFILPLRIERLTGSAPILISPDLYIPSENWADGLRQLQERLIKDGVPRHQPPDYQKIISWWPAVSAHEALVRKGPSELITNLLPFVSLPKSIHFLKVASEGNLLSGRDQLKGALPSGYQEIVVLALPEVISSDTSYLDKDDDTLMKEILAWVGDTPPASQGSHFANGSFRTPYSDPL
jgi:hypothetical protein